jgi:hypothetical protein
MALLEVQPMRVDVQGCERLPSQDGELLLLEDDDVDSDDDVHVAEAVPDGNADQDQDRDAHAGEPTAVGLDRSSHSS